MKGKLQILLILMIISPYWQAQAGGGPWSIILTTALLLLVPGAIIFRRELKQLAQNLAVNFREGQRDYVRQENGSSQVDQPAQMEQPTYY